MKENAFNKISAISVHDFNWFLFKDVRDRKILHTDFFLKVQCTIIQNIFSRKLMKKITVTDEKIFRVHKAFDRKNNSHGLDDFPPTAVSEKGCQYREEDYENKVLS